MVDRSSESTTMTGRARNASGQQSRSKTSGPMVFGLDNRANTRTVLGRGETDLAIPRLLIKRRTLEVVRGTKLEIGDVLKEIHGAVDYFGVFCWSLFSLHLMILAKSPCLLFI